MLRVLDAGSLLLNSIGEFLNIKSNKDIYLSIVIPAYREEKKITQDIEAASTYLKEKDIKGEIIVVDDGSPDKTASIARKLVDNISNLQVISYKPNRGKGYAIREGISKSRGKYVMFADSGLCVPYGYADLGIEKLQNDCDIAIGSRRFPGAEIVRDQPFYRKIGSRVFWWIVRSWLSLPNNITDTQCGFKIFKGDVARDLYTRCIIDRFMIDIDMLCRAKRAGYCVKEFPVKWGNDADTRYSVFSGTIQNFVQLYKIWLDTKVTNRENNGQV